MGRKVTVSLEVIYDFRGEVLKDYLEWLDDYRDNAGMRKWFVIDRAFGHDNVNELLMKKVFDPKVKLKVKEEK